MAQLIRKTSENNNLKGLKTLGCVLYLLEGIFVKVHLNQELVILI